jgi:hypothetical protein
LLRPWTSGLVDAALQRIEDDTYGYCEETGEPISLKRLEARPIATLGWRAGLVSHAGQDHLTTVSTLRSRALRGTKQSCFIKG